MCFYIIFIDIYTCTVNSTQSISNQGLSTNTYFQLVSVTITITNFLPLY